MIDWNKLSPPQKQILLEFMEYVFVINGQGLDDLRVMLGLMDGIKPGVYPNILGDARNEMSKVIGKLQLYSKVELFVTTLQSQYPDNDYIRRFPDLMRAVGVKPRNDVVDDLGWNDQKGQLWLQGIASGGGWQNLQAFASRLTEVGESICLVSIGEAARGTGILIDSSTILTNHHVIADIIGASDPKASVSFDYGSDTKGKSKGAKVSFKQGKPENWLKYFSPSGEAGPGILDFAVVELAGPAPKTMNGKARNPASLDAALYTPQGKPLIIVHHPGAEPQSISLGSSLGVDAGGQRLRYNPDTRDGSSGGGVYNAKLELVALHHAARVPAVGQGWNQGVPVSLIREAIMAEGGTVG